MVADVSKQIKQPVQLGTSIKSEMEISSYADDDDYDDDDDGNGNDNGVREDDAECKEFVENVERNCDEAHPVEIVSDL